MTLLITAFDCLVLAAVYFLFLLPRFRSRTSLVSGTLFYLYLCMVICFTMLPVIPTFDTPNINLLPFRDYFYRFGDYERQIVLNVLLFAPMGFFITLHRHTGFVKTVLLCAAVSLAVELLQPWVTVGRVCDVTDLITNTAGAALGYLAALPVRAIMKKRKDRTG